MKKEWQQTWQKTEYALTMLCPLLLSCKPQSEVWAKFKQYTKNCEIVVQEGIKEGRGGEGKGRRGHARDLHSPNLKEWRKYKIIFTAHRKSNSYLSCILGESCQVSHLCVKILYW